MIISPFKSVGNLLFSDDREGIRKKINEKYTSGVKGFGEFAEYYDYFEPSEIFVYYDKNNTITAFEFFKHNPVFNGIDLLNISYSKLMKYFLKIDHNLINDYDGFTSIYYGIGANASGDPEDENTFPEAVIVFRKGYYDPLELYPVS